MKYHKTINNLQLLKLSVVFVLLATLLMGIFTAVLATSDIPLVYGVNGVKRIPTAPTDQEIASLGDSQGSGISIDEYTEMFARLASKGDEALYEIILAEMTDPEMRATITPLENPFD